MLSEGIVNALWCLPQPRFSIGKKRVEQHAFWACAMAFMKAILAASSGGLAYVNPVGCPIAVSGKLCWVDERFDQIGTDAVGGFPIGRHGACR